MLNTNTGPDPLENKVLIFGLVKSPDTKQPQSSDPKELCSFCYLFENRCHLHFAILHRIRTRDKD